jgi:hypothetical protein
MYLEVINILSPVWWGASVIPALGRLRQDDCIFKASLRSTGRPCLKNNYKKKNPLIYIFHISDKCI